MAVTRLAQGLSLALLLGATSASGQTAVRGTVLLREDGTPVAGAIVTALGARQSTSTDRLGRFVVSLGGLPDTLIAGGIGWAPDTLILTTLPDGPIGLALSRRAVVIADLMVTASATRLDLSESGRWRMPLAAARSVPPAVETDVYRALALVPGVSYTSPLSARPMIRGYDAAESATRIDGFEIVNLYHVGRVFSSFPADAAADVTVTAAPYTAAHGGAPGGLIDITGRTGTPRDLKGGAGVSFGSLSAWISGGGPARRYFAATRILNLEAADLIPGVELPYHFADLYAGAVFGPIDRPSGRATLFATRDAIGEPDDGLRWSNLLFGMRARAIERGAAAVDVHGSISRFVQRGANVPSLYRASADFHNALRRVAVGADLTVSLEHWRLGAGATIGRRGVENDIAERATPGAPGAGLRSDTRVSRWEATSYVEVTRRLGSLAVGIGSRAERAGGFQSVEPRAHARWTIAPGLEAGGGVGRTARLYQLVADARSEPDLEFLDFWLDPADSVPLPRVDHAALDLHFGRERFIARVSAFVSAGRGIGELRPETDQQFRGASHFRFGRSRTQGVEVQVALRGPSSISISYVHARSERDWGEGWVRWAQDRRQQFRALAQTGWGRLAVSGMVEAATGMPLTPLTGSVTRELPGDAPGGAAYFAPATIHGPENSAGTSGTLRADAALTYRFGGPDGRRFVVGLSVVNLVFGAVAPVSHRGDGQFARDQLGRPTIYRRLFDLPAIPTLTLRGEW